MQSAIQAECNNTETASKNGITVHICMYLK
jgi:hypothetical protein